MNAHVTIAFHGDFRPIHAEAETLEQAVAAMRERVTGKPLETLETLWKDFKQMRNAGISIESTSSQHGGTSIAIRDFPRDKWLDKITASLPVSRYERGEA